jgi:hypothetical protein
MRRAAAFPEGSCLFDAEITAFDVTGHRDPTDVHAVLPIVVSGNAKIQCRGGKYENERVRNHAPNIKSRLLL